MFVLSFHIHLRYFFMFIISECSWDILHVICWSSEVSTHNSKFLRFYLRSVSVGQYSYLSGTLLHLSAEVLSDGNFILCFDIIFEIHLIVTDFIWILMAVAHSMWSWQKNVVIGIKLCGKMRQWKKVDKLFDQIRVHSQTVVCKNKKRIISEISEFVSYKWCSWNYVSMSPDCNVIKTRR